MKEESILINNLKINYKIAGEGPAILILHGWGGSSGSWKKVQKILAKEHFKTIALDLPGFGKSVTPPKPWEVQNYKNLVFDFTERLKISSFSLLGHSFGGRIAIKFAKDHPEKIKKLILCDSAGIRPKPEFDTRLAYLIARIGNALFSKKPFLRFRDGARNSFYMFLRHRDYVKADGVMRETVKRIVEEDLEPLLSQIKTQTLIIWGEIDRMVPLKYAYLFQEKIPNSKLEILLKIGHSPNLEAPEKLAKIIINFLKE